MAKFIFRLENILQIKYKLEEQEKINFSLAAAKLLEAEEKLMALKEKQRLYEDKLKVKLIEGGNVKELRGMEEAVQVVRMNVKIQLFEVSVQERNVENAREKLNEAMKERKTYERLKEHEFERFMKEVNDQENKETDELVSYKFASSSVEDE